MGSLGFLVTGILLILDVIICCILVPKIKRYKQNRQSGEYPNPISSVFLILAVLIIGFFLLASIDAFSFFDLESFLIGIVYLALIPCSLLFHCGYFAPYLVAYKKQHQSQIAILIVNLFFGVTLIGWIIALVWANSNPNKGTTTIIENHDSAADELKKYKELFDSGAITNEEYEQKKRELLGFGGSPSANPAPQSETASASQSEDDFTV